MKPSALILEGGGNRGVFTAGALDYLMEKENPFDYVVGVSAGACNALDYVSKQPGRTRDCMISEDGSTTRLTVREAIKKRSLFDMDRLFSEYPYGEHPFDFDTYFSSDLKCGIVMTNCLTGAAEIRDERKDGHRLMLYCRASCSLPLVAPIVTVDGTPYLDGGIADSVPLVHALRSGYKRCVVILTRNAGYRKKTSRTMLRLCRLQYGRKYPAFVKAFEQRARRYNQTMELIEDLESRGHIFVLRPEIPAVSKAETDPEKLLAFYDHGYELMKEKYEAMAAFLRR